MENELTKEEREVLHDMAEKAVSIPEGKKVGSWTREKRVALVFAALCSIYRLNKVKGLKK